MLRESAVRRGIKKARRNVVTEIVIRRFFFRYIENIYGAREFMKNKSHTKKIKISVTDERKLEFI